MDDDPLSLLRRAFSSTRAEVDATERAQLTLPTPCTGWDVRALVNHIIGGAEWYGAAMREGVTAPIDEVDDDYAAGDFHAAYAAEIDAAVDAYAAPGALDRTVEYVGSPLPGRVVARFCALDTFVHGWDLARALGRPTDLDPEVAEWLHANAAPRVPASFRGTGADALYHPPAATTDGATAADRLAAALGRTLTAPARGR